MNNRHLSPTDGWEKMDVSGFADMIGPLWSCQKNDAWRYAFQTSVAHINPIGIIHGGMITSLADHAMSIAAWFHAGKNAVATVQLDMRFMSSAKPDDFIEAAPFIRHVSKTLIFVEADLMVNDKQIAVASGVWKILGSK